MTSVEERVARFDAREPLCGSDFCDGCGDCLACYAEDLCYGTSPPDVAHSWVVYSDGCAEVLRGGHYP